MKRFKNVSPTPEQFQRCLRYLREVIVKEAREKGEHLEYAITKRLAQELAWRESL